MRNYCHMEQRALGTSELNVSRLGWGTVKLGRNQGLKYPTTFELPTDVQAIDIVLGMLDAGITLVDTAPAYGLAQARLGQALGARRDSVVLVTKVGETFDAQTGTSHFAFDGPSARATLEDNLRLLRTDHVDVLLVHSDGNDLANQRDDYISALLDLRSSGLTRTVGFSGKTVAGHQHAIAWADVIMVPLHMEDTSHVDVIEDAAEHGVGVLVKKALSSGHLDAEAALAWCWHDAPCAASIASVVVGSLSPQRMAANATVLNPQG
jgi:aryl-alcohol dehydrogenase-like predicted oxidoreductase